MANHIVRHEDVLAIVEEATTDMVDLWRNSDDGWGEYPATPNGPMAESDAYTTAGASIWLSTYDAERYWEAIESSLDRLGVWQHRRELFGPERGDGGWGWKSDHDSDSTATALALYAYTNYFRRRGLAVGQDYILSMGPARDWLVRTMHGNAGMPLFPRKESSRAFNTAWSVMALADCLAIPNLKAPYIRGLLGTTLTFVQHARNLGGWGVTLGQDQDPDTIGTAYTIWLMQQMVREGFLTRQDVDLSINRCAWLRGHTLEDGSWETADNRPPVEATSWAIIALLNSGENPKTNLIQNGVRYLKSKYRQHKGWLGADGEPLTWLSYYACYALWTYGQAVQHLQGGPEQGHQTTPPSKLTKLFIAHGQTDLHPQVASLLRELRLEPVILEDVDTVGSESIDRKLFRTLEDINYGIVLFDDGRDNVVQEWGILVQKLSARRVWLLVKKGMEGRIPSNMRGAEYILVDETGRWKDQLISGLRAAGLIT